MSKRIKVVDSPMGSGKTSWAISKMNSLPEDARALYVTPFLDETERIEESCPKLNFHRPNARKGNGRKMTHLLQLIQEGRNISSTHSLFSNISQDVIEALKASNYILILDEAFQVLEGFDMWKNDFSMAGADYKAEKTRQNIDTLTNKGFIKVSENFQVSWIDSENPLDKYAQMKRLADRGLLYIIRGSLLLWSFPTELFSEGIFNDVYVLTYQFSAQLQSYYYKYFGISYETFHIDGEYGHYRIVESKDDSHDLEFRRKLKENIILVDSPKLNKIGEPYADTSAKMRSSTLSKGWYNRFLESLAPILRDNMSNFFQNIAHSKASERMWTSFSSDKENLRGKNVNPKHWVALNSRATNAYREKRAVAYLINRFLNPYYSAFFNARGITLNQDFFALAEMLQFLLRSGLRDGKKVHVYIPSRRMRLLLLAYLDNNPIDATAYEYIDP